MHAHKQTLYNKCASEATKCERVRVSGKETIINTRYSYVPRFLRFSVQHVYTNSVCFATLLRARNISILQLHTLRQPASQRAHTHTRTHSGYGFSSSLHTSTHNIFIYLERTLRLNFHFKNSLSTVYIGLSDRCYIAITIRFENYYY